MTETELYEYVVKKAVSFGTKPKNIPGGYKLEDVSPDEGGNAIIRHSLMKGAYIGLIDSGQSIIEDNFEAGEVNDVTGGYTGLSFVVFTQCNAKSQSEAKEQSNRNQTHCIVSIGIGSSSLGEDIGLASKPGFRRSFMKLTKKINDEKVKYFFVENWAAMETRTPGLIDYIDEIEIKEDKKPDKSGPLHMSLEIYDKKKLLPAACVIELPDNTDHGIPALDAWLAQYAIWRGWLSASKLPDKIDAIFQAKRVPDKTEDEILKEIEDLINNKDHKYIVLQGAPGCGKTYIANKLAKKYGERVKFIQFHAETTYADFVYGIKPVLNGKDIAYKGEKGILLQIIDEAKKDPENDYLLIIDEINRANLANVLGPVFYLFESKREESKHNLILGKEFIEQYGKEEDIVYKEMPKNIHVIATMNTADKSLAVVDFALRRRFAWYTLFPRELLSKQHKNFNKKLFIKIASLFERYATDDELSLQPGHSYFITKEKENNIEDKLNDEMKLRLKYEIMPLMKEYFAEGYLAEAKNEFAQLYFKYTGEYMYK